MPRPVVPIALGPLACSRALSSATCDGRIRGQLGEIRRRSNTGTPCSSNSALSAINASSERTTPLPRKQRTCSRNMPEGIDRRIVLRPPMTSVCPALCPPWKRATADARSVSRSTTLPLPSSPHCVPMTTTNLPTAPAPNCHQRTKKRRMMPTSMLPSPAIRNSRSVTSRSLANARFTPRGCRNGAIPSNTKNRARAASRSLKFKDTGSSCRSALAGVGIFQVFEELPVRGHHEQVAVFAERALIGLQAAEKRIELRIFGVSLGVGLGCGRLALTANLECVALRIGEYLGTLAVGGRRDRLPGALSFRTQLARDLHEVLLHAFIDAGTDVVGQIDPLHAHVHQIYSKVRHVTASLSDHVFRYRCPVSRDDLFEGSLSHDALDSVLHDLRDALTGEVLTATRGLIVA